MLRGAIVTLRPAGEGDRRAIYEWLTESDLTASMLGPPNFPETRAPTWEEYLVDYGDHFFDGSRPEYERSFVIEAEGEPVGQVNYEIDAESGLAELDIWMRGEAYCGHGYGSDALIALTHYLHRQFGVQAAILRPSRRNERAIRAYTKAGFTLLDFTQDEQALLFGAGDYPDTVVLLKRMDEGGS